MYNNSELNNDAFLKSLINDVRDWQIEEAWSTNDIEALEIDFTWYDNGYDNDGNELIGYAIDFGSFRSFLYTSYEDALNDFEMLQRQLKDQDIYIRFFDSSDMDDPRDHVDTVYGQKKNKAILANLAIHEMQAMIANKDWTAIDELLQFVPAKNLIGFLSEDRLPKLGLL
jgi:hypothetical protein